MPNNLAQLQTNLNIQAQGVEISTGNTVYNKLISTMQQSTQLALNTEYLTGSGPFQIGSATVLVYLLCVVNKAAANSITLTWNVDNTAGGTNQFQLAPNGLFFYFDPLAANFLGNVVVSAGANVINVEVITGTTV